MGHRPLTSSPEIGLVAGELSGDMLGGSLIAALQHIVEEEGLSEMPRLSGMTGPNMQQAGCQSICTIDQLSVMGIFDVLKALPRIYFRVYQKLYRHFASHPPSLYVGIDAPDFNLRLAGKLKRRHGIRTVQYVSPTVWAWRASRVETIRKNIDHMLVLFPFEREFFSRHDVACTYVGHPLADQIELSPPAKAACCERLGLPDGKMYLALLPGSRGSEVRALLPDFLETARLCQQRHPDLEILIPAAHARVAEMIRSTLSGWSGRPDSVHVFQNRVRDVVGASSAVLTASGTATLEIMLLKRPMVVAYRLGGLTYRLIRRLYYSRFFALPNLLADTELVPEYLQEAISPQTMADDLLRYLQAESETDAMLRAFASLHQALRCDAGRTAARKIVELLP